MDSTSETQDNQPKIHLYEVGATEFRAYKNGGGWRANFTFNILTTSIQRALDLCMEAHPDAEAHSVIKRDRVESIHYDPRLT